MSAVPLTDEQRRARRSAADADATIRTPRGFLPFEEAREYARSLNLQNKAAWMTWAKSGQRPADIPSNPANTYYDQGWVSMGDWLGTGYVAPKGRTYLPFEEARHVARSLNLQGKDGWAVWAGSGERPAGIPAEPAHVYKDQGWVSWGDWLGTGTIATYRRTYLPFEDARAYARSLNLQSGAAWWTWARSGKRPADIPGDPADTYKHRGWVGMGDWLGTGTIATHRRTYLPFEEARAYVRSLNLQSGAAWWTWARSGDRPADIPGTPHHVYKHRGWVGMGDWLGTGTLGPQDYVFRPFEETREYVRALNLQNRAAWATWCKSGQRPTDIPANPASVYKDRGWVSWGDWLGTGYVAPQDRTYLPFEEARHFVRAHNLQTSTAWQSWAGSGARPAGIPSHPDMVYKDQGWVSYGDWLGTGYVAHQNRTYLPFEEARHFVRALNLQGRDGWAAWAGSGARPAGIPADPARTYKDQGWVSMGDWLGTGSAATSRRTYLPFEEARAYVRALNLQSTAAWATWAKSGQRPAGIPAGPARTYKDQGWVGMGDWLGTGTLGPQDYVFRPFEDARAYARSLNLQSTAAWATWAKSGRRPADIPANPASVYKDQGWVGYGDWLGTGSVATFRRTYRPFEDARAYARSLNLPGRNGWAAWSKSIARPANIPSNPQLTYEDTGWVSWGDWLGTGTIATYRRTYLPFEDARAYARSLNLQTWAAWATWAKSGQLPAGVPANPVHTYKDQGWVGMGDWLRANSVEAPSQWTIAAVRRLVASLGDHLASLTPAELYVLFQQNGMLTSERAGGRFARAVLDGAVPPGEIEKFAAGEPSQVDDIISTDPVSEGTSPDTGPVLAPEIDPDADLARVVVSDAAEETPDLPLVETADALAALARVVSSADAEAVEFLIASAMRKMWAHAFRDEAAAVAQAEAAPESDYTQQAARRFLDEYRAATALPLPAGYAFRGRDGRLSEPHLMQRLIASQVQTKRRVGNWSGTGAGKTLAAVLASRVIDAGLTVITCPNNVIDGWVDTLKNAFPDSLIDVKTWNAPVPDEATGFEARAHRYLLLNYEMFQQPDSPQHVRRLVETEPIDLLVIDEVQAVKQSDVRAITQRRENIAMLVSQASVRNPELGVLGMSATPVVNNLQEGKSLVELLTGLEHTELPTRPTLGNCMKLHQQLVRLGIREMPNYSMGLTTVTEPIELSDAAMDEIRGLGPKPTILGLERILTRERLPAILKRVKQGTLIYTELLDGIEKPLRDALVGAGFTVGFFTGEDKTGRDAFLRGEVDVLIGSSAVGTGVDGLQAVCDTLILNVLPWTAAQYDQILGRVYRQGQRRDVTIVLPLTYAVVDDERWSWCESKMKRLHFKRSIADAAVDGVVPIGHLRSPQQALKDQLGWLKRLDAGAIETISRRPLLIPLPPADADEDARRRARYGDFSGMNRRINGARSEVTHARFEEHPDEWGEYHARFREQRRGWPVVPVEEVIRYYEGRRGLVIADFGAGEAQLAAALGDRHTVHSFDHVAIDDRVTACDMAHTPLADASLDAAVFSLSLMGANFGDYLREAARTLKRDGVLHIYEASSRFGASPAEVEANRQAFARQLHDFGFDVVAPTDRWKFTYIKAIRNERPPRTDAPIAFK